VSCRIAARPDGGRRRGHALAAVLAALGLAFAAAVLASACEHRRQPPLAIGAHRFVSEGGVALAYHVAGAGPVCIVHPGGPGMEWRYLRMPELERRLTLVYLEPAGTGASDALPDPDGYTRERYAVDVDALRRALGRERICLIGHSAGGKVALAYAIAYPERLERLVLYGTSAVTDEAWERDSAAAVAARADEPWFAAADAARTADIPPVPGDCPKFKRIAPFYFADWTGRRAELAPFVDAFRCWPASRAGKPKPSDDLRPQLAGLRAPTLVATGRRDFLFPPTWGQATADAIPGARHVVFERSGHFAHVEEPAAFAAAVADFVTGP
jgi:proline iminopeptidase